MDDLVSNLKRTFFTRKTIVLRLRESSADLPFRHEGVEVVTNSGLDLKLSVDTSRISIETVLSLIVRDYQLEDVTIEDPPMEQIITRIYERTGKEESPNGIVHS
jgi:ABC-2 type transport system ATP-binding protein